MIPRPQRDEYGDSQAGYVNEVPEGVDIFALLEQQMITLTALLKNVTEEQANIHPAPGEWSIKEVVGHINDTERIFAYRAMRFARSDGTPLPGFEQDGYVNATHFNDRTLADLLEEFVAQRKANVLCFKPLSEAEIARRGTASNTSLTVRAMLYILAGHVIHHIKSLQTDYKVSPTQ